MKEGTNKLSLYRSTEPRDFDDIKLPDIDSVAAAEKWQGHLVTQTSIICKEHLKHPKNN
jgi:hypothetical protein